MSNGIQPYRGDHVRPSFRNATVADTITPVIITCPPETPLENIAELMVPHVEQDVCDRGVVTSHT